MTFSQLQDLLHAAMVDPLPTVAVHGGVSPADPSTVGDDAEPTEEVVKP